MNGVHCAFLGRVGRDGELRFLADGTPLISTSVLVQDTKTEGDGQWIRVSLFGDQADALVEKLLKGAEVYVEGRLKLNSWAAADGTPRSGLNVTAWRLELVGRIGRPRSAPESEFEKTRRAAV